MFVFKKSKASELRLSDQLNSYREGKLSGGILNSYNNNQAEI